MKKIIFVFNLTAQLLFTHLSSLTPEEHFIKRINAHFLVNDYQAALLEAKEAANTFPDSSEVLEIYMQALAKSGEERECLSVWKHYSVQFSLNEKVRNKVAEDIAWATIQKSSTSHSPPLRMMGILAAYLSQDAKGILVLKKGMRDQNLLVRAATVKLCTKLKDAILQDEVIRIVREKSPWKVRVEAIRAAGGMKIDSLKPELLAIASDPSVHALEKAAAISSLVQTQEKISRKELKQLVASDRAGLKLLACEIAAHLDLKQDVDLLMPLLSDHCPDVRAQVLYTIGLLRIPVDPSKGMVSKLLNDPDPRVAITAAWAMTLSHADIGQTFLSKYLNDGDEDIRRLAAGALSATGKHGMPLMESVFKNTKDSYVRLNLAMGMIGQRAATQEAADVIFRSLGTLNEQWMENEEELFTFISPSHLKHDDLVPNLPEAVNQTTRLQLLNLLAILKYPQAQTAIREFLKEKKWGITGMASAVLLTEGDEEAISLVQQLLNDPDSEIRLQAAMVLALWGGGEDALAVLQNAYETAVFEDKEKILEGIGRIGAKKSIPFLMDKFNEPHQSLRLIAAAGLIMTLYQ